MKTVKGSTNPFQETISLLYNIDAEKNGKQLELIEQEATILYYVSDIQYIIFKRNLETKLGKELSFDEINAILSKQNYRLPELDLRLLNTEDLALINSDIHYLAKYNELYTGLNCNQKVLELLLNIYAKRYNSVLEFGDVLENIKKHQIMVKLGIREHLKTNNKTLNERIENYRLQKRKKDDSVIEIISATISKSHVK